MHITLQNSALCLKRITYCFYFWSIFLRQGRKGRWHIYKLYRNEVTKRFFRRDDFCHHYFTEKFYIIIVPSFWWYMILIKHHDDHDDVYVSHNISSQWYFLNDLSDSTSLWWRCIDVEIPAKIYSSDLNFFILIINILFFLNLFLWDMNGYHMSGW